MYINLGMPQIIMLIIYGINIGSSLVNHGKQREGKHSFWATLVATGLSAWILSSGGFFG